MKFQPLLLRLALLFFCTALARPVLAASGAVAEVRGVVTDSSGQPLAGVEVQLRPGGGAEHGEAAGRGAGRLVAQATTDARGRFSLPPAGTGTYTLTAAGAGFRPATQEVVLPLPGGQPLSIVLAAGYAETVVVQVPPLSGPGISATGANDYTAAAKDIESLPAGASTTLTDVLARMPGVAFDQNAQIHIRNTEGPQFQYQINGVLVPLDINTNPPFLSMINPMFIKQVDLLDGILPARYSYATGGVVDITTKDGCSQPGGSLEILAGQRDTIQPSLQYGGCEGKLSYYVSSLYGQSNTAFSSATPGPTPIHDWTNQGQAFGFFTYQLDPSTKLSVLTSAAASDNQLPNVPNLAPAFNLAGVASFPSANINSYLDFRDYLVSVALSGSLGQNLTYQVAYSLHSITQAFKPDDAGELIFQGVASTATHDDTDNTLQGDLTYRLDHHTLGAGFYLGTYRVAADDSSLVFPVDGNGNQTSDVPLHIVDNAGATNVISGLYVNDLWQITDRLRANLGLRWDDLTGFTDRNQVDPTVNLSFLATPDTTLHAGFARYMQVPSFLGIPPNASVVFAGTTAGGPPGISSPLAEDDYEWDAGVVHRLSAHLTISEDNFYEITHHYLDTGQFGVVPIFAPFNYDHGYIWGSEIALGYRADKLSAYTNVTVGSNRQIGVATGQFNFDPDELAFIQTHHIPLDHQPLVGIAAGATYDLHPYSFGLDAIYSSGLRGGFADQEALPAVVQVNVNAQRSFRVPGLGQITDRLIFLNVFDRVNLIRPAEGIGIFQSAYGPRFTILNLLTIPL
jgi:outer membrane cobalamin receptor